MPTDARPPGTVISTTDPQHRSHALTRPERQLVKRRRAVEPGRGRLEIEGGDPLYSIQPQIPQNDRRIGPALGGHLATLRALLPSDLEQIGKVGAKSDPEVHTMLPGIEIVHE